MRSISSVEPSGESIRRSEGKGSKGGMELVVVGLLLCRLVGRPSFPECRLILLYELLAAGSRDKFLWGRRGLRKKPAQREIVFTDRLLGVDGGSVFIIKGGRYNRSVAGRAFGGCVLRRGHRGRSNNKLMRCFTGALSPTTLAKPLRGGGRRLGGLAASGAAYAPEMRNNAVAKLLRRTARLLFALSRREEQWFT